MALAAVFPLVVKEPVAAVMVLVVAGLSDVADGWVARRYGLATPTGAVLDGIIDKLFVFAVALSLVANDYLPPIAVLLLSTREIGELPLVIWFALSPTARSARAGTPSANAGGKLATTIQFVAIAWALFRLPRLELWIAAAAVAGTLAAVGYWVRMLKSARRLAADPARAAS